MVYQDRHETNVLQLFAHPENSEGFSIISVIIVKVKFVAEDANATAIPIMWALLR